MSEVDHCFNRIGSELGQVEDYIKQLEIERWAFRLLHKACYEKGYRPDASDRTFNPICTALAVAEARLREEGTVLTPLEALERIGKLPGVQEALKDEGKE